MSTELSIVIPFYNEVKRLDPHFSVLTQILSQDISLEIIYVDDGSQDDALVLIQKKLEKINSHQKFSFYKLEKNLGKGGAIREGVLRAQGKFILYTDFDFAIHFREITVFLNLLKNLPDQKGIIAASRKKQESILKNQSFIRKIAGNCFHRFMKLIVGVPVRDTQCGFKMFDAQTGKEIFKNVEITGFAFDVEFLYRAYIKKIPIKEQGVYVHLDDQHSTIRLYIDPFKMLYDLISLRLRILFL